MISVPVYDMHGKALEPVEVDETRLGIRVNLPLMRQAVQMYENNQHVCTKAQLTRAEVAATTKKMYRQKHTGSARAGQRSTPVRRGGGVPFAAKPRDISYRMPKKALHNAAKSALLSRLVDNEVSLISGLAIDAPKTAVISKLLKAIDAPRRSLLVVEGDNPNVWKSGRNIAKLSIQRAADINAYDMLKPDRVLFTQAAFQQVLETLAK